MSRGKIKIETACWTSFNSVLVSFNKDWYSSRTPILIWRPENIEISDVKQRSPHLYGIDSGYYLTDNKIHFILYQNRYPGIDWKNNNVYVVGDFNDWSYHLAKSKWMLQSVKIDSKNYQRFSIDRNELRNDKTYRFKFITQSGRWLEIPSDTPNIITDKNGNTNYVIKFNKGGAHQFYITTPFSFYNGSKSEITLLNNESRQTVKIDPGTFLLDLESSVELGSIVDGNETIFRIFSPRAKTVTVSFFNNLNYPDFITLNLNRVENTIWEIIHPENLHGWYYYFQIDGHDNDTFSNFNSEFKILDPYALATVSPSGPGIIWDKKKLPTTSKKFQPPSWHDLIILEAHIRDLVKLAPIDLSDSDRLGFNGLKKWVETNGNYLTELGVNAVELQPIQEFDAEKPENYHWGYMTNNFFSPSSSYASDPENGSQIPEFKSLIESFHKKKLAVILDVVYNHVGEPNHLLFIDKYYNFEIAANGSLINWTGTGNTLRCSAPMIKKLIIDSLIHLIEVYDIDGFRFDLAEILGVEVLLEIEKALKQVKPSIILIAEPWSFRGHIALDLKSTGFAFWNDKYREFIKDYIMGNGNFEGISYFLEGSLKHLTSFPAQSINYVESHDDFCWIDKITENKDHNGNIPTPNDRRRSHLLIAVLMSSIGIPMISAGQDMLRSKRGVHNTYLRGDLNAIDYDRAINYSGTHEYFRKWIKFRSSTKGSVFRLTTKPTEKYFQMYGADNSSAIALEYNSDLSLPTNRLLFAINPGQRKISISIDDTEMKNYKQIADHERFDEQGLTGALINVKNNNLSLPAMSCGLWLEH